MIKKIDHIGIAVKSLEESISFYETTLGMDFEKIEEVPSQKVKVAFFKIGEVHIELLEPQSPDSPIQKFLEKKGIGIHHIAYQTDAIESDLLAASNLGCQLINESPVEGAGGKKVAFLHPKSTGGVLTEFCGQ